MAQSEVRAYKYILDELAGKKGWNKGQILTQQECHKIPAIKKALGKKTPENVVKIDEKTFYVLEAKNSRSKIKQAVKEAENDYADEINKFGDINAVFITGIAGNDEEGYLCKSKYYKNGKWEIINENDYELTGLLSKKQVEKILETGNSNIKDIEIDEGEFLKAAENINETLHRGAINKDYRARVIAALLLAIAEGTEINVSEKPTILIKSINSRVDLMLKKHNKIDFSRFIKLELPSSEDNHTKFKNALVLTIQELLELNIRSAMRSNLDILGKFYEAFLKYGNGAKEIGIVLTPRHITKFAAKILDIQSNDLVLDISCGTGGFLVAALDEVKQKESSEKDFDAFKRHGIYGVEQQDPVVALALVNMIFRGDGKNNIIEGDCFKKWLNVTSEDGKDFAEFIDSDKLDRIPPITKVLMNPPFAQKKTDEKEYLFVDHALKQMQDDGLLFCVLPMSVMLKGGAYKTWRKEILLKNNTLISVITFPEDLFYPVGVRTVGIIVKKGAPHDFKKEVFWAKINEDGFVKSKGKRLFSKTSINNLEKITDFVQNFIGGSPLNLNEPRFYRTACIDKKDKQFELIPEVYLDEGIISIEDTVVEIDKIIRNLFTFLIQSKDLKKPLVSEFVKHKTIQLDNKKVNYANIPLLDMFDIKRGYYHVSANLDNGAIPLISCKTVDSGIEGYFKIDECINENCITIASDGSWPMTSFYQPFKFGCKDNVIICKTKQNLSLKTLLFITAQLNSQIWRFSYGRKCYLNKVDKIVVSLPVKNGKVDEKRVEEIVNSCSIWDDIQTIKNL